MISNKVVSNSSEFKLINCPDNFVSGRTSLFYDKWRTITTDVNILKIIKNGCTLKFDSEPVQFSIPNTLNFNETKFKMIDKEIMKFIDKGIIEETISSGGYFSNIFSREKKRWGSQNYIKLEIVK